MNQNYIYELSENLIRMAKKEIPLDEGMDLLGVIDFLGKTKNYQSFEWCLLNLHNFQFNSAREFAIKNVCDFVFAYWCQIPTALYPVLIDELFTKVFQDPNYQEKKFLPLIYKTQNLLVHELYPNHWPNFFDALLSAPKENLYGFLFFFNSSMYETASMHVRDVQKFLNQCLADGSQAKILQIVVNDTINGVDLAAKALMPTIEWISFSLLMNSELISLFIKLLTVKNTCELGLNVFITIFKRPLSLDIRYELVNQLQLINMIEQVAKNYGDNEAILVLCAKLLYQSMHQLSSTPIIASCLPLAMNLFMVPNTESSNSIYMLLTSIFGSNPNIASEFISCLMAKITSSVSLNMVGADIILEKALEAFISAANNTNFDFVPNLISLANGLDPQTNIVEISSLIVALKSVMLSRDIIDDNSDRKNFNTLMAIAQMFAPIMTLRPPFISPHYIAMSNYLAMIRPILDHLDPVFTAQIFIQCTNLVLFEDEKEDSFSIKDKKNLFESLLSACELVPTMIVQIPDVKAVLPMFLETGEDDLFKAASLLVAVLDPIERVQFYTQSLNIFPAMIENANNNKNVINRILEFFSLAKTDDIQPQIGPMMMQFFLSLHNLLKPLKNSLLTAFINSSVNVLGINAFEIFWSTYYKDLIKHENAEIIMKYSMPLAQLPPDDMKVKQVCQLISDSLSHIRPYNNMKLMNHSDEVRSLRNLCEGASKFLLALLPNLQQSALFTAISHLIKIMLSLNLETSLMNEVTKVFLIDPSRFVNEIDGIFELFMKMLNEFKTCDTEELHELLFNLLTLLRFLNKLVPNMTWDHRKWGKFANLADEGPDIMAAIVSADDEHFQPMVEEFLSQVSPPRINSDNINFADDEFQDPDDDL